VQSEPILSIALSNHLIKPTLKTLPQYSLGNALYWRSYCVFAALKALSHTANVAGITAALSNRVISVEGKRAAVWVLNI
jgi:hypothetical protein